MRKCQKWNDNDNEDASEHANKKQSIDNYTNTNTHDNWNHNETITSKHAKLHNW